MLSRRGLLRGLLAAPAIIRTPGLLMPVKPVRLSMYQLRDLLLPGLRSIEVAYRGTYDLWLDDDLQILDYKTGLPLFGPVPT